MGLDVQRRFLSEKREIMTLEELRAELRIELAPIRAVLDALRYVGRSVTVIQQDVRALRAAFNDFAGEINTLHADVNRVQIEYAALAAKITTLERLVSELQKQP
jgi:chromosome segregation ATPase